jgi:CHAT domain-containing protein/tetratricopeptide (TPR) repeat protein
LLDRGDPVAAEPAAREALAALDRQDPAGTLATARTLDLLAQAQNESTSGQDQVEAELDRAIAIKSRLLGERDPSVAVSLRLLAAHKRLESDYRAAAAILERAKAIQDASAAAPAAERADVISLLGEIYTDRGRYTDAEPLLKEALAMREKEFGPESGPYADSLTRLAANYWMSGQMAKAKRIIERSIRLHEAVRGPDHPETAHALGTLGAILKLTNNFTEARTYYERAAAIYEKRLGPYAPRLGVQLNNLGLCLKELDEFEKAGELLERAAAIFEKSLGADNSRTATAIGNAGIVYAQLGDLGRAIQAYGRALAIQERRLGPDHPLVGSVLNSMGLAYQHLGDSAEARKCLTRALEIYRRKTGPENPKTVDVMNSLGVTLLDLGEKADALHLFEQAVEIRSRILGPDKSDLAGSLNQLGQALFEQHDYPNARRRYEQAWEIQQKLYGPNHHSSANTLSNLGKVALAQGDFRLAESYAAQSAAGFRKAFGGESSNLAYALRVQAQAQGHAGRNEEALESALGAARVWREHVRLILRSIPERLALLFVSSGNEGLQVALSLASAGRPLSGPARQELWDAVIRNRALALDEMAERHRAAGAAGDPETAALEGHLSAARTTLARLVVQGPPKSGSGYAARLEQSRRDVEAAEQRLADKVGAFRRRLASGRRGYAEVAGALPAGSALVAYVRYQRELWTKTAAPAQPSYLAFVARAGQEAPGVIPLGSAAAIDNLVAEWRRQIRREADSMSRNAKANEQAYRTAGAALRRAVWDPLAAHVRGAASVYVVPDGSLQLVNLQTLPAGESGYLAETRTLFHTLSAERDLAERDLPEPATSAHAGGLLAIGNPAYQNAPTGHQPLLVSQTMFRGAHSRCTDFASMRFEPLPASAAEIRTVLSIWTGRQESSTSLTAAAATEAAFKQSASGKRVIHLATHGFFLEEQCGGDTAIRENPLLRAGLVLAGANHRQSAGPDDEDGILTAEEVASLNLQGTELVVLSGCDTGTGEVRAGEGVLGLRRAFRIAGAETLISSLWPVSDEDARDWMSIFYRARFRHDRSIAESMRTAMRTQLTRRRAKGQSTHPFYWGSFLAVGN